MAKVYITSINNSEFKGIIFDPSLTPEQLTTLGLTAEEAGEIHVEGCFHIDWDGEIPVVYVNGMYNDDKELKKCIPLPETQFDYDEVAAQIEVLGRLQDWLSDKHAADADHAYDSYMDS